MLLEFPGTAEGGVGGVVAVGPTQVSRAMRSPICAVWSWSRPSRGVCAELLSRDGGRVRGVGGAGFCTGEQWQDTGVPPGEPVLAVSVEKRGGAVKGQEKTQTAPPPSAELT